MKLEFVRELIEIRREIDVTFMELLRPQYDVHCSKSGSSFVLSQQPLVAVVKIGLSGCALMVVLRF